MVVRLQLNSVGAPKGIGNTNPHSYCILISAWMTKVMYLLSLAKVGLSYISIPTFTEYTSSGSFYTHDGEFMSVPETNTGHYRIPNLSLIPNAPLFELEKEFTTAW